MVLQGHPKSNVKFCKFHQMSEKMEIFTNNLSFSLLLWEHNVFIEFLNLLGFQNCTSYGFNQIWKQKNLVFWNDDLVKCCTNSQYP